MRLLFTYGKVRFTLPFFSSHDYLLVHNHVNDRLKGDVTEDPKNPKIQFPPAYLCPNCRLRNQNNANEFDSLNTVTFLLRYYSKENIDLSSVENFVPSHDNKGDVISPKDHKASIEQYSMIEINNEATQKSGLFRFLTSVIQRFPLYFFISFVIIIIFARRRYCKIKRERYTL
jgi:hypothetical protein